MSYANGDIMMELAKNNNKIFEKDGEAYFEPPREPQKRERFLDFT